MCLLYSHLTLLPHSPHYGHSLLCGALSHTKQFSATPTYCSTSPTQLWHYLPKKSSIFHTWRGQCLKYTPVHHFRHRQELRFSPVFPTNKVGQFQQLPAWVWFARVAHRTLWKLTFHSLLKGYDKEVFQFIKGYDKGYRWTAKWRALRRLRGWISTGAPVPVG